MNAIYARSFTEVTGISNPHWLVVKQEASVEKWIISPNLCRPSIKSFPGAKNKIKWNKNKKNHSDFILKKIKDFNAYNFEGIFSNLLLMLNVWPTTCYLPGQENEGGTNSSMSSWQCGQWAQVWELLIKAWEGPRDQPGRGESIKHNLNTRFLIV